jgi:hypothetical protein
MRPHDRAVDHGVLIIRIARQHLKQLLPYLALGPAREARMDLDRVAKAFRQVPPGDAGPIAVDHRLYKKPIVLGRYPYVPFTSGQNILNPVPLIVPKGVAAHLSAPNQLTAYESRDNALGNPLIEDRL